MFTMIVLIDNGHGVECRGNRSPDARIYEWRYTREIAERVQQRLTQEGIFSGLLVPETTNISLKERVARANRMYEINNGKVILVSIHNNAFTRGWNPANGWSVHISPVASQNSKRLAEIFADEAAKHVWVRKCSPTQSYWRQNLYILNKTQCPAVLTENLFMTNREDVEFLLSDEGKQKIVDIHVEAIKRYISSLA